MPDERVVSLDELAPRAIAHCGRTLRRPDEVGEEDRREHTVAENAEEHTY